MSKKTDEVEYYNLTCKFGDKNLLDLFSEIVYPAFSDNSLIRKYGEVSYFFNEVSIIDNEYLVGRIIKDEIIKQEQVFLPENGLKKSEDKMQSSPSSLFVLVLENHRLIFLYETSRAPSIDNFKITLRKFLSKKYFDYIDELKKSSPEKITKKSLMEKIKKPSLDITPLSSDSEIDSYIDRYGFVSSVRYILKARNSEIDNSDFFANLQNQQELNGSSQTEVVHRNNKSGLNKENLKLDVIRAAAHGNQEIRIIGKDLDGNKLSGDNNHFKLKAVIDKAGTFIERVNLMIGSFNANVKNGVIKIPSRGELSSSIDRFRLGEFVSKFDNKLKNLSFEKKHIISPLLIPHKPTDDKDNE